MAQEIDSHKDRRSPPVADLHWENLGSALQHVSGQPAIFSRPHRLNVVTLEPGQYVDFQVPSHELIRVQTCCAQTLDDEQLEIWTSNGTGLFRKLKSARTTDRLSMIAAPDHSGISIGRILRPTSATSPLTAAVFTSAQQPGRLLDYYQCPVICDQKQVKVSDDRGRKPRLYTALKSGRRYPLEVEGSARLRLESRLKYDSDSSQHQFYWIKIFIDGILHETLLFDTLPQRMHRQFVAGDERLIGGREFAYLDLDSENQSVEIEVSHSLFLRADAIGLQLLNPQVNHQFNPPALEALWLDEDAWLERDFAGDGKTLDDYLEGGVGDQQGSVAPQWDPWQNYPKLVQVARDNHVRLGGLRAYMWMRAIAASRKGESNFGDELTVAELVTKIRNRFTYYRDLQPVDLQGSTNPRVVAFPVRSIRRPNQPATETIVGQQHIDEASARLSTTTLHQIPISGELIYRPTEQLGASLLRVIVDRQRLQSETRLWIQYDQRPPFELKLIPESALEVSAMVPGRAEAAVASLGESHRRYDSGPWGGPFATLAQPVAMIKAGTAEFLLPSSVKQIKIHTQSEDGDTAYIGVQCLLSGPAQLSEVARVKHKRRAGNQAVPDGFSSKQLENDSVDFQRLRDGHLQQIDKSITPGLDLQSPTELWYQKLLETHRAKALGQAEQGNWIGVLETLSDIIHHTSGGDRNATIVSRTQVLDQAGESFLADRERRGWLKFSTDVELKREMLRLLLEASQNDPAADSARELLLAFAATEIDDEATHVKFSKQLADNGRFRFALLALPESATGDDIDELVLRCSFQLRWWKTFKSALKDINSIERRNFWGAMKSLHLGQFQRAWRLLDAAGPEGQVWLKHWKYGDYIYTRLSSDEFLTRMSAIEDWESWLAKHPGPRVWNAERGLVVASQGAATLYSPQRDLRMDFSRSEADLTSTIRVHGPATIRLECRPLHQSAVPKSGTADDAAISGVIEVRSGEQLERVPVLNNVASDTLEIDGLKHVLTPGKRIIAELKIPAGLKELELTSRNLDILFRVLIQRPEVMSPVLPPITETTLAAVVLGKFGPRCEEIGVQEVGLRGKRSDGVVVTNSVRLVSRELRGQSIDHPFRQYDGGELDLEALQPHLDSQMGDIPTWQNRVYPSASPFVLLNQDEVYKRALGIVYDQAALASLDSDLRLQQIAQLEVISQENAGHRNLSELSKWLQGGFTFTRFEQFDSRAGIYLEKLNTWRPLAPGIRVRKTLLGDVRATRTIIGDAVVELDLSTVFAPEIEVSLTRPRVGFLPTRDTVVAWEAGGQTQSVTLAAHDQTEKFRLKLDSGVDKIRLWQPQPWANHFVLVNVAEVLPNGSTEAVSSSDSRPTIAPQINSWHVATADEPLAFRASGPSVYRIDRLNADGVATKVIPVLEANRTFELLPEGDNRVGRFRIYQLAVADSVAPIYRPSTKTQATPIANDPVLTENWLSHSVDQVFASVEDSTGSHWTQSDGQNSWPSWIGLAGLRSPDAEPVDVALADVSQPGVYDTGTTGFHFGYRERRAIDEFPVLGVPGRFFELGLSSRKFDRWKNEYSQTDYLLRPRIGTGPTFGLSHQRTRNLGTVNRRNDDSADSRGPWQLNWRGYAFGQYAGSPIREPASSFPWTTGFNASLSRVHHINSRLSHRPSIRIFGRYLSESRDGFEDGELDQDIFTRYKLNHRFGLRFADQFVYQRYLDRRFYLRPMLNSNEDQLIPDNIGFSVGTDQLLGPVQMHLGYRLTGFLSDNDRVETAVQNVLRMDLKAERWSPDGFRSEVDLSLIHEIEGGTSFGISFSRYFSDGRHYRDFRPGSILFRSLRQENAIKTDSRFSN